MPWHDRFTPARMCRAVIVAPQSRWQTVMSDTADLGVFQPDETDPEQLHALLTEDGLQAHAVGMSASERCSLLLGWTPSSDIGSLRSRLQSSGGAVVELPLPAGVSPPSLLAPFAGRAGRVLVDTYSTVPYNDVDPTAFATIAYIVMFGMMFGDVGHGAILAIIGLMARGINRPSMVAVQRVWMIIVGAGLASMAFGLLYGEAFGPTGLVPVLWLEPLREPDVLLVAGVVVGAVLLAVTFVMASIDRWREGGLTKTLYSSSGLAGGFVFAGVAAVVGGLASNSGLLWKTGLGVGLLGVALTVVGLVAELGATASAVLQIFIEVFDVLLRLGSNLVSFARLAAFGLTHAAISKVVWDATTAMWGSPIGSATAILIFVAGNALAFALEALVAGIQALRLEYYELFSRLFLSEGKPFHPWHTSTLTISSATNPSANVSARSTSEIS